MGCSPDSPFRLRVWLHETIILRATAGAIQPLTYIIPRPSLALTKNWTICVPWFVLYHYSGYIPIAVSQVGSYKSWLSHILYHYSGYIPIAVSQVGSYKSCRQATNRAVISCWPATLTLGSLQRLIKSVHPHPFFCEEKATARRICSEFLLSDVMHFWVVRSSWMGWNYHWQQCCFLFDFLPSFKLSTSCLGRMSCAKRHACEHLTVMHDTLNYFLMHCDDWTIAVETSVKLYYPLIRVQSTGFISRHCKENPQKQIFEMG